MDSKQSVVQKAATAVQTGIPFVIILKHLSGLEIESKKNGQRYAKLLAEGREPMLVASRLWKT